jgi:hypothetical protein
MAPLQLGNFIQHPQLRTDGSNFALWYERLREFLIKQGLIYTIEEPIGAYPGDFAINWNEWQDRRDLYNEVKYTVFFSMVAELRDQLTGYEPDEMIFLLKEMFSSQVRRMAHVWFCRFHSQMMEENTCLQTHLAIMHRIHKRLTDDLNHEMTHAHAIWVLLGSLPPSYAKVVAGYLERDESLTFNEFLARLRNVVVDPIAGEVID